MIVSGWNVPNQRNNASIVKPETRWQIVFRFTFPSSSVQCPLRRHRPTAQRAGLLRRADNLNYAVVLGLGLLYERQQQLLDDALQARDARLKPRIV
jgi:hypothetical protein